MFIINLDFCSNITSIHFGAESLQARGRVQWPAMNPFPAGPASYPNETIESTIVYDVRSGLGPPIRGPEPTTFHLESCQREHSTTWTP